jgi:glycosyltransferase involved in cell wall biosynthesis
MTILHLDSGREMRGGQWQVLRLLRGLRKRGHNCLLLAEKKGRLLEAARAEHFKCDSLGVGALRWVSRQADVVHAHDARSHTLAAIFSARPFLVSRRVIFPVERGPLSRWKYSRAKLYAAVSLAVAAQLKRAGIPEHKIRVVYDGVPLLPDRWDFRGPAVVPRFDDERKDNTLPMEAAKLAHVPALRSNNLEADLEGASMLIYVTSSEGLGSAALLAMSAGVPVIASNVGGLREVVVPGQTGMLVPNTVDAVVAAIGQLKTSIDVSRAMSQQARQIVAEKFNEDRMVVQTLALYESIRLVRHAR